MRRARPLDLPLPRGVGAKGAALEGARVLLIEDDDDVRQLARTVFEDEGWQVWTEPSPPSPEELRSRAPAVVVLDWYVGAGAAERFLEALSADPALRHVGVVIWTAAPSAEIAAVRRRFPRLVAIEKPAVVPELVDAVRSVLAS